MPETLDEAHGRFNTLIQRFREQARRDGLLDDGPMTPVTEILQLCMFMLFEVTARNVKNTEQHAAQVVGAIDKAQKGAHAVAEQTKAELTGHIAGRGIWLAEAVAKQITGKLEVSLEKRVNQVPLRTTMWIGAAVLVIGIVTGWTSHGWLGSDTSALRESVKNSTRIATTETVLATIRDSKNDLAALLFKDGMSTRQNWLNLMRWNDLEDSLTGCSTDPTLIKTGAEGRIICNIPLWISAPDSTTPIVKVAQPIPPVQKTPPAALVTLPDNPNQLGLKPPRFGPKP